jgi:hypothetical protein
MAKSAVALLAFEHHFPAPSRVAKFYAGNVRLALAKDALTRHLLDSVIFAVLTRFAGANGAIANRDMAGKAAR